MKIGQMKPSKYLKKDDVGDGKIFTIKTIRHENVAGDNQPEELKYVMYFNESEKGIVMNWTNLQLAAVVCGSEDTDDWAGKQLVLFNDPTISFGGKITGGIRIRKPQGEVAAKPADERNPPPFDDEIPGF